MQYYDEEKKDASKSTSQSAASIQKAASSVASPSQQPVWTQAMGNYPPANLQMKLTVSQPGDPYEQEADRVADQVVMRKHKATPAMLGEEEEEQRLMRKQRSSSAQAAQGESAPPIVNRALSSGGQPLDAGTQASMASHFGQDFSDVRIHTDGQAAESAQAINARAYTVGKDVVFGEGQYAPGTSEGERLLTHELTHVVQQEQRCVQPTSSVNGMINDDTALERETDVMASAINPLQSRRHTNTLTFSSVPSTMIQRKVIPHREQDKLLDAFITALDALVSTCAQTALAVDGLASDHDGYIARWIKVASEYLESKDIPSFLYTTYGYAVETLANQQLATLPLPPGYEYLTQVSHGPTRPDIVVRVTADQKEIAWIDITSEGSEEHIFTNKTGAGWKTMLYVYEITYPRLNPTDITNKGSLAERLKARTAERRAKRDYELKKVKLVKDLKLIKSSFGEGDEGIVPTHARTREAFKNRFGQYLAHNTIRSLITEAGLNLEDFGYKGEAKKGRDLASAKKIIERYS